MDKLDDKILNAIRSETEQSLEEYSEDLGIFQLIGESFKGAFGWVVMIAVVLIIIFAGVAIYSGFQMYGTADIASKLNWLGLGLVAFIIFAILRLWFFMELNRLSIKRDIKRVELQVSLLGSKLAESGRDRT